MQPFRWARISGNRLRNICKLVPISRDTHVPRCRTWNLSHTLYTFILPEATRGLHPTSTIDPVVHIKSLFDKLFKGPCTRHLHPFASLPRCARSLCLVRKNWCRFARSSIRRLHSGPISRWLTKFAIMVGRKVDSRRV